MFFRPQKPFTIKPLRQDDMPWIVAALALTVAPHIIRLPIWLTVIMVAIAFFTLAVNAKKIKAPGKLLIAILGFSALIAIAFQYRRIFGRDAGSALLIVMLFLKLLETKNYRDGMVMIFATIFLVITNFLYTQSIPTAIYMLVVVSFIIGALIKLNQLNPIPPKIILRKASTMLAQALPIMLLLFVLFPRIPGPLWGLPADAHSGKTGLSDKMEPGSISNLALSSEAAFRVTFETAPPPNNQLYWRGLILWDFNGKTWRASYPYHSGNLPASVKEGSRQYQYTVTLEPHDKRWLFALDIPSTNYQYANDVRINRDYLLYSRRPVVNLKQYTVQSELSYTISPELEPAQRQAGLRLPANSNPRTLALALEWRNQYFTAEDVVNHAIRFFNQNNFFYTLRPPLLNSTHNIDEFLFDTQRGFCEHYAGSFVFLMRAAGIPARVVTGYQGGELNPIGNYMLVRQSDAHAWAEVWIKNKGWIRVDPTAAVSPMRIENGLDEAIPQSEVPRFILKRSDALYATLSLAWDSVNNRWNEWVIGYGPETQQLFLSLLGFVKGNAYDMIFAMVIGMGILIGFIAFFMFRQKTQLNADPIQNIYLEFCALLKKAGCPRLSYEGPLEYNQRIRTQLPTRENEIHQIAHLYTQLRYGLVSNEQTVNLLKTKIKTLRRTLKERKS